MMSVSKIGFLGGAVQEAVAFAGALAPISGLLAVLPAVGATVATTFAVVKIATSGMGDAFKAVASGDAKALDEAMKKLAPEAQAVVKEYAKLKPALDSLKLDVQNQFWKDQAGVISDLAAKYLPTLHTGLTKVAGSAGNLFAGSLINITENTAAMGSLNNIFNDTSTTLDQMGGALGDVLVGVINMAGAASNWIPLWTNGLSDITSGFAEWSSSAAGQQQINDWISKGADALGKLFQIFSNIGSTIGSVFGAMQAGSGGMLENLVELTSQMAAWAQSAEGQETLVGIFTLLHAVFEGVLGVIGVILPIVTNLANAFTSLDPEVQGVVGSVIAWSGALGTMIGYAAPVIGFLGEHGAMLMNIARVSGNVLMAIGRVTVAIVQMAVQLAIRAVQMAASWIIAMGPIGWIILAVVALVALIIYNWDWVKAKTIEIWGAVSTWLVGIWNSIVGWATGIWNAVAAWFAGIWQSVVTAWQTAWNAVAAFLQPIWDVIVSIITVAWDVIKNIFVFVAAIILALFFTIWNPLSALVMTIWNAIVEFLTMIWNGIVAQATALWTMLSTAVTMANQAIMDFIMPIWNAIVEFLTMIWNNIVAGATTIWNILSTAVTQANQAISDFIMPIWNAIVAFLTGLWNGIVAQATALWNLLSSAVTAANNAIMSVITSVWNAIWGFISPIMTKIGSFISSVWNSIWTTISGFGSKIAGIAGQAVNWLVSAGKNIVTGLWNGIVSMGTWLYNQIMGWVKSVVPGPILSFLGIASPSRWMRDEVGKQIPAGVGVGIIANAKVAADAAATMAQKVGAAASTATEQEMSVSQKLMPMTGVSNLPAEIQQRLGSLALSTSPAAMSATGTSVTTASVANSTTNNSSGTTIGTLTIPVTGIIDPTDPVSWRRFGEQVRELITEVEESYR